MKVTLDILFNQLLIGFIAFVYLFPGLSTERWKVHNVDVVLNYVVFRLQIAPIMETFFAIFRHTDGYLVGLESPVLPGTS